VAAPSRARWGRRARPAATATATAPAPPAAGGGDEEPFDQEHEPDVATGVRWGGGDVAMGILAGLVGANLTLLLAISLSGAVTVATGRGSGIGWAVGQALTDAAPSALRTWANLSIEWRLLGNVGLWIGLLGVTIWAVRTKGTTLRDDLGLTATWRDVPVGLAFGAVGFAAVQLLMWPVAALVGGDAVSAPARSLGDSAGGPVGVALLVVMTVVVAPVVEEVFYRGLAQRAFIRRLGVRWGIVAAALVFAALHLQDLQFPALVLVGLLFGWLAHRHGRLGPAVFAHVGYNAVNVALLVWVLG
jgi:membrane protease YdiL (CAAX protease family)